jgi:hypothetical protein
MKAATERVRITEKVLRAHFNCVRKSYLLMFSREQSKLTEYASIMEYRKGLVRANYLDGLILEPVNADQPSLPIQPMILNGIADSPISSDILSTESVIFKIVAGTGNFGKCRYEPVIFTTSHALRQEDKLEVCFAGYVLSMIHGTLCWAHLIRDLNDDLRKSPFDAELETFVSSVRDLIVPIFEAVDKYGLKTRHLRKFSKSVDQFYKRQISGKTYRSDLVNTYQKRFSKYRDKLFVFLNSDGVPWNNNMAERALRHIAVQRKISGSFGKDTIMQYLLLLGITQSCRFQNKSLLQFLLSGEKDVDKFKGRRDFVGCSMR